MSNNESPERTVSPWEQSPADAGDYIRKAKQEINYRVIAGGDEQILFLGENHLNLSLFKDIETHAVDLKASGINALLVEAPHDQDFKPINEGDFSNLAALDLGPTLGRTEVKIARQKMVQALIEAKISVLPIDERKLAEATLRSTEAVLSDARQREVNLANRISTAQGQFGKIVVLVGLGHASRGTKTDISGKPYKEAIEILEADRNTRCKSVFFTGGESSTLNKRLIDALAASNLQGEPFMLKPKYPDSSAPYAQARPDWIVFYPLRKSSTDVYIQQDQ